MLLTELASGREEVPVCSSDSSTPQRRQSAVDGAPRLLSWHVSAAGVGTGPLDMHTDGSLHRRCRRAVLCRCGWLSLFLVCAAAVKASLAVRCCVAVAGCHCFWYVPQLLRLLPPCGVAVAGCHCFWYVPQLLRLLPPCGVVSLWLAVTVSGMCRGC